MRSRLAHTHSLSPGTVAKLTSLHLPLCSNSVLRPADLVRYRAASASAILVMANRFSSDVDTEDLDVLFRVWAIKSFTKCVPLTVQVSGLTL